jgi:hypothetical protein
MTTPNMNLTLPLVSQTPGPTWASQINADLTLIDQHDHTAGKGSPITSAAININSDLLFNSHSATGLQSIQLEDQIALVTTNTIYTISGNLYFNNGSSSPVQITLGGSLAGAAGTISGLPSGTASASFNSGTGTFVFAQATNTGGILDTATLKVRSTSPSSNSIDITTPTGTVGYTLTLPIAPPVSGYSVLTMGASGTVVNQAPDATITLTGSTIKVGVIGNANIGTDAVDSAQIKQGAVTPIKLSAATVAYTAASGTAARTNTSWADVFLASATFTVTTVRPIVVQLQGDDSQAQCWINSPSGNTDLRFRILTPSGNQYRGTILVPAGYKYPPNLSYVFTPTVTGTYSFNFQGQQTSGSPYYVYNCSLVAYQL